MPRASRLDGHALPIEAWANGGGATRTFGRENDADGNALWRVSLATLTGPSRFSRFPGLDRTFVLIDQPGVELHTPDGVLHARRGQPVRFCGDTSVQLAMPAVPPHAPAHALNVMTRRERCHARVQIATDDASIELAATTHFLISLSGTWRIASATPEDDAHPDLDPNLDLAPWQALRFAHSAAPINAHPIAGPHPLLACIALQRGDATDC